MKKGTTVFVTKTLKRYVDIIIFSNTVINNHLKITKPTCSQAPQCG